MSGFLEFLHNGRDFVEEPDAIMVIHTGLISRQSFDFGLKWFAALAPGDGMKCREVGLERFGL